MTGQAIRRIILEQSKRANVGHIGSCLSIADIISSLYGQILNLPSHDDPQRDRFVLSKGHAALAVYAALHLKGWISREELNTFCGNETLLSVHPEHRQKGIDFCTGSLGQGLPMATGAALAARLQASSRRVFAVLSDAECNEGSIWEAAMFAAHHKLSNLIAIIDLNGQQALGYTQDIVDLSPMRARWEAFGWDTYDIDGHDEQAIVQAIKELRGDKPHVLVAHTTFGKGVSYMENTIKWHYSSMSEENYRMALADIEKVP